MRKLILILFVLGISGILFAKGNTEKPLEITFLHSGPTAISATDNHIDYAIRKLKADFPNVEVTASKIDLSTGSSISMDAMLASGTPPNVYADTMVRLSKYSVPEFALPLDGLIRDLDKYPAATLAPYRRDGKLLALPIPGGAQAMCVNMDIMAEINFQPSYDWTIADFLKMCALVKAKYGNEKWGTYLFAANQSGDYLLHNWFSAFGAEYYQNSNYDKTTIRQTGGVKAYQFYKTLIDNGYVRDHAATLTDDDYAADWAAGKIAACAFYESWTKPYFDTAIANGQIKKPFAYKFFPFPKADKNAKGTPTYVSNGAYVVHKTGTEADKIAARLVEYLNSAEVQIGAYNMTQVIPNRTDAKVTIDNPRIAEVAEITARNGIYDAGLTSPLFTPRRAVQFGVLQDLFNGKATPEQAIERYEAALNGVK